MKTLPVHHLRRSSGWCRPASWTAPALFLCVLVLAHPDVQGSVFLEESHDLAAGWNLINVSLEPVDGTPATALSGIDWESIWTWLPSDSEPRGGRWLVQYRDAPAFLGSLSTSSGTSALFRFTGPNAYLIATRSGGVLRIKGAVRSARQSLKGNVFQLFSPSFERSSPPTLASYFSRPGVKDHVGVAFELAGPTYRRLNPGDALRPGAAYWVLPNQDIPTPDPLRLTVGLGGMHFDAQTTLQELVLNVGSAVATGNDPIPRQLKLRALPSVGTTSGTDWLELQRPDGTFGRLEVGATVDLAPEETQVRLAFRARSEKISAPESGGKVAVVEIAGAAGKAVVEAELSVPNLRGTWMGEVSLSEVDRPSSGGGGFAPAPVVPVSLILEIPEAGPSRLLPCVSVESARDGRKIQVRLSAALFPEIVTLSGAISPDGTSGTLRGTFTMGAEHPLNPYRHRYNPEHTVGYEITRSVKISVGAEGPEQGPQNPLAGVGGLSGVYEEEINGLTQEPIRMRGAFRLRQFTSNTVTPCGGTGQ